MLLLLSLDVLEFENIVSSENVFFPSVSVRSTRLLLSYTFPTRILGEKTRFTYTQRKMSSLIVCGVRMTASNRSYERVVYRCNTPLTTVIREHGYEQQSRTSRSLFLLFSSRNVVFHIHNISRLRTELIATLQGG